MVLREMAVQDTPTVGSFTRIPYPSIASSGRWALGREDKICAFPSVKQPAWVNPTIERLNELSALRAGWDPRGSQAVSEDDLNEAVAFLNSAMNHDSPPPAITPLPSGGIELAWSVGGTELEVVFDSSQNERVALLDIDGQDYELPPEDALGFVEFLGSHDLVTG
jgi:hypothetical protein